MTLERVYDELMSMIEDLRSDQRLANSAITDLQKETQGAQQVTGNPITITDAAPINAEKLVVEFTPIQEGSGVPSPTNIRPITGYAGIEVTTTDDISDPTTTNTASISFGQTVYGGSVNFKTGVVTVDRASVDLGSLNYTRTSSSGIYRFQVNLSGAKGSGSNSAAANAVCSCYKNDSWVNTATTANDCSIAIIGTGEIMAVQDDRYTDATAFKTAVTGETLCYELATPITIQLTPDELKMLKGINNISTEGNTTIDITYQPDNVLGQILAISEADDYATLNAAKAYADSVVTITPALESGTKLADYTISGTAGIIYAPGELTTRKTTKKSTKEE